ncbi:hypothetical protein GCM10028822_41320 [Hymenobacter terrigena]
MTCVGFVGLIRSSYALSALTGAGVMVGAVAITVATPHLLAVFRGLSVVTSYPANDCKNKPKSADDTGGGSAKAKPPAGIRK